MTIELPVIAAPFLTVRLDGLHLMTQDSDDAGVDPEGVTTAAIIKLTPNFPINSVIPIAGHGYLPTTMIWLVVPVGSTWSLPNDSPYKDNALVPKLEWPFEQKIVNLADPDLLTDATEYLVEIDVFDVRASNAPSITTLTGVLNCADKDPATVVDLLSTIALAASSVLSPVVQGPQGPQGDISGLIPKSIVDAKGDLLVGTADNTATRLPVGTNGQVLVADASDATGLKWRRSDGLVASVTVTHNPEFVVSAVDVGTGTFTSNAHGLSNNDKIFPMSNLANAVPYPLAVFPGGVVSRKYFVVNATTNTFQLSLTAGGAAITLSTRATMDLTKFHFEKGMVNAFGIIGLPPASFYRAVYRGRVSEAGTCYLQPVNGTWAVLQPHGRSDWIGGGSGSAGKNYSFMMSGGGTVAGYLEAKMFANNATLSFSGMWINQNTESANTLVPFSVTYIALVPQASLIESILMTTNVDFLANGSIIEVYAQ